MALALSLPALLTRVQAEIELRPPKVKEWLEALPLLNVAETGQRLLTSLSAYNRIAIEPATRLALLELYRPAVRQITRELQKRYVGLPLPLPDKAKGAADAGRQLHTEMAYGYKHVVMAHADDSARPVREAIALALPIQRAMRYLTDVLIGAYTDYSPPPAGTWQELHTLYRHGEQLGLVHSPVVDAMNAARPTVCVGDAYKHALLLDCSDPYHLPARLVLRGDTYLDRYADVAQLTDVPTHFDPTCQFLIDTAADRAGVPYGDNAQATAPERHRLLNTIELARLIHAQLMLLQHGQTPEADGLPADFYADGGGELLRRLIQAWGVHPQRAYRRNPRAQAHVEVAVGLSASHYWLNGGRPLDRSSNFVGPLPRGEALSHTAAQTQAPTEPPYPREHWHVDDESAGGMALSKRGLVRAPVRVGDLIAVRFPDDGDWALVAVCWVRSANPSDVQIGKQRLAPSAQPVLVQSEAAPAGADFLPALRLPALPALQQPKTLLVPRGVYKPERRFHIDDGYRLYPVRGTHLVELTSAYERFQYEDTDSGS